MAAVAARNEASTPTRGPLTFLDLPLETQREIISHCSQNDLICVALVSSHFRELASARIYRDFHIVFTDDDDESFDSPIDGLASGLDTLTTSEYNYAKHLRDISLDTLTAGRKGENSYRPYLYSNSCGKFLNTLLLLALKRATSLEAFRWNIRVELTRQVYRELHRMPSLKRLQIRMQAGESYYVPPPPLPTAHALPVDNPLEAPPWGHPIPPLPTIPSTVPLPLTDGPSPLTGGPTVASSQPKSLPRSRTSKHSSHVKEPPTFSGFRNLKSLSVLDIDELGIVPELKDCIANSSASLTELELSLSVHLASKSRRPAPEPDIDDFDVDDDLQLTPSHSMANDTSGPVKAFHANEERKVHEALLGRLFGVEFPSNSLPKVDEKTADEPSPKEDASENEGAKENNDPHQEFVTSLRSVSEQLMTVVHGTYTRSDSHQEILEMIEKAARKYVSLTTTNQQGNGDSSKSNQDADTDGRSANERPQPSQELDQNASTAAETPSPTNNIKGKGSDENEKALEEIDMEHPEDPEDGNNDFLDGTKADVGSSQASSGPDGAVTLATESGDSMPPVEISMLPVQEACGEEARLMKEAQCLQSNIDGLKCRMLVLRSKGVPDQVADIDALEGKIKVLDSMILDLNSQLRKLRDLRNPDGSASTADGKGRQKQSAFDYLRQTRGFPLETLSIHLIPVKASVLSRAIDLSCLKSLTLLNVGNQAPIWTLLTKENKTQPLALRSVFTDNVSDSLLLFLSQLEELHELFMLERSSKSKPESTAPRTTNTIDQIRRTVLNKHMGHLKRLMIRNESSTSNWDVNEKAMVHICTHGKELEELAVGLNIQAVHAFMQYISGAAKLRALHILRFRNNDTCVWVRREIRRFIVDNLSHHPESKLEWIATQDERVDRVVRASPVDEKLQRESTEKQILRNNKAALETASLGSFIPHSSTYPMLPSIPLESDSDSDSDNDSDDGSDGPRLRFKTVGPMRFYDVWGIKIFEKEIRSGCL
ncbi:F-box domain [Geosmithia morbida]|uniref:F-box domain n=1 Tax=Geosmithia morbida TaxID=1094350 RepID=A0A9P5D9F4_9HYPO|nr:F-box domain [Geosmithia morbida]KAF4126469.1 F-box domain [Geosmithia morbida]